MYALIIMILNRIPYHSKFFEEYHFDIYTRQKWSRRLHDDSNECHNCETSITLWYPDQRCETALRAYHFAKSKTPRCDAPLNWKWYSKSGAIQWFSEVHADKTYYKRDAQTKDVVIAEHVCQPMNAVECKSEFAPRQRSDRSANKSSTGGEQTCRMQFPRRFDTEQQHSITIETLYPKSFWIILLRGT